MGRAVACPRRARHGASRRPCRQSVQLKDTAGASPRVSRVASDEQVFGARILSEHASEVGAFFKRVCSGTGYTVPAAEADPRGTAASKSPLLSRHGSKGVAAPPCAPSTRGRKQIVITTQCATLVYCQWHADAGYTTNSAQLRVYGRGRASSRGGRPEQQQQRRHTAPSARRTLLCTQRHPAIRHPA